jgi:iron complex transport system ATP-binding protein
MARPQGRTIVAVLHDLNHVCRYAAVSEGRPQDIVSEDLVATVFGLSALVIDDPVSGTPLVVPGGGGRKMRPGP